MANSATLKEYKEKSAHQNWYHINLYISRDKETPFLTFPGLNKLIKQSHKEGLPFRRFISKKLKDIADDLSTL